jgi:hypothetical protein
MGSTFLCTICVSSHNWTQTCGSIILQTLAIRHSPLTESYSIGEFGKVLHYIIFLKGKICRRVFLKYKSFVKANPHDLEVQDN